MSSFFCLFVFVLILLWEMLKKGSSICVFRRCLCIGNVEEKIMILDLCFQAIFTTLSFFFFFFVGKVEAKIMILNLCFQAIFKYFFWEMLKKIMVPDLCPCDFYYSLVFFFFYSQDLPKWTFWRAKYIVKCTIEKIFSTKKLFSGNRNSDTFFLT